MQFSISALRQRFSVHRVRQILSRPRSLALLTGALGGIYLLTWCQSFFGHFGTSLPVVTGIALALAAAAELGLRSVRFRGGTVSTAPMHFLLAAWTVAMPWLVDLVLAGTASISPDAMASPWFAIAYALAVAALLVGMPVFALCRLCALHARSLADRTHVADQFRATLAGVLLGLTADVFLVAPMLGTQLPGLLAALCGAAVALWHLATGEPSASGESPAPLPAHSDQASRGAFGIWACAAVAGIGVLTALGLRMATELSAAAAYLLYAGWAAIGLGWILGSRWSQRRPDTGATAAPSAACLVAAAWSAVLLGGFEQAVEAVLTVNAFVSSVAAQMLLRSLITGLILFPFGWAWGAIASAGSRAIGRPIPQFFSIPFAAGLLACGWFGIPVVGVAALTAGAGYGLLALAAILWIGRRPLPSAWWRRAAVAGTLVVALAGPTAWNTYNPAASAELLFSTNVFMARQRGLDLHALRVVDEGRELARLEGDHGTLTLWKHRGVQYQIREGGVPKGLSTAEPHICPHYSPEALQAALPLMLHQQARRVLLLGAGAGVSLSTTLSFPVQDVTCVESSAAVRTLLQEHVWPAAKIDPLADTRFRWMPLDPALALACRPGGYDVIVSSPDMAALHRSAPYYAREFYGNAARQLAADGIFCQRLQYLDFGPEPLQTVARTLRTCFQHVLLVEVAAGEFVLLGSNAPEGLVRPGLVDRLQKPQVRQTLSHLGWDWSTPLSISAFNDEALDQVCLQDSIGQWLLHKLGLADRPQVPATTNNAGEGLLAFSLPQDMMRWAPKTQQVYTLLAPHAGQLARWSDPDSDAELPRRLSEVASQRSLMAENPDQYWDYRRTVRDKIKQGPRTRVIPVKGESPRQVIHPVDQRRMDYFEALGKALNEQPARAVTIDRVAEFAAPYDPMISYFLHQEIAELHSRAIDRDVHAELGHRLHAIYFAHGSDKSVRNIADALTLLAKHPEAVDDPQKRFDHLNALLQLLRVRWEMRGADPPAAARIMMNDVDECLAATQQALAAMDGLSRDLPAVSQDWPARRDYLERTVERPLRTYRTRLLPHHLKDLKKTREALEEYSGL